MTLWNIGQIVQNDGSIAIMADDERIALVDDFETPGGQARANLIVAAPAMYKALEPLRQFTDEQLKEVYRHRFADKDHFEYGDDAAWVRTVNAAIQQAKGD